MQPPARPAHPDTASVEPSHKRAHAIRRALLTILALNVAVALAKLGYGLRTHSLSMTADGLNSLLDGASNVVGLAGLAVAVRPPDPNHPYGHRRFETLTTLAMAAFMLLALEHILQGVWERWRGGGQVEVTGVSFVVMLATLVINIGVTLWERRAGARLRSTILIADARHTGSDVVVTISVIIGLALVKLGVAAADLVLSLVVAAVIAWAAWTVVREAALALSDAALASIPDIEAAARAAPGVRGVHNVRTRGGEGQTWVDLHIQVAAQLPVERAHAIASDVAARVEERIGEPADVTVHVEPDSPEHLRAARGYTPPTD